MSVCLVDIPMGKIKITEGGGYSVIIQTNLRFMVLRSGRPAN